MPKDQMELVEADVKKRPVEISGQDAHEVDALRANVLDRLMHAWQARFTYSISPAAMLVALMDWGIHVLNAPGKQGVLYEKAIRKWVRLVMYVERALRDPSIEPCIQPLPQDMRFSGKAWSQLPYSFIYQAFLLHQQWWHNATTGTRGVSPAHERIVEFTLRQMLDVFSPSNFLMTNPEVINKTFLEGGQNLIRGFQHWVEDWERGIAGRKIVGTEAFKVGKDVATTEGKVVFRNELIELLQYAPTTKKVHPEPILIVPAWIMKYYILDLSPSNSLVRYLVDSGFTVFMISWRNPSAEQRDLDMEDYRQLGIYAALKAINAICPDRSVHACGYCLGGTMLSIAAATMARDGDKRLKSVSLFAAETDFTEAGELSLFISDSQVAYLEDMMWEQGYLDTRQMAGAFQLLRSNDLIWSQGIKQYLMGERLPMTDLMAWNADATRMPYRMHSQYLKRLFVDNELAEGHYRVEGRPIALSDIRQPMFVVGTISDHVAPWHSVYKIHILTDTALTFVLTSGGHNAGIVSEPRHLGRHFQMATRPQDGPFVDPDSWRASAAELQGSWWTAWVDWLRKHSSPSDASPPEMGNRVAGYPPLANAPGQYVLEA